MTFIHTLHPRAMAPAHLPPFEARGFNPVGAATAAGGAAVGVATTAANAAGDAANTAAAAVNTAAGAVNTAAGAVSVSGSLLGGCPDLSGIYRERRETLTRLLQHCKSFSR